MQESDIRQARLLIAAGGSVGVGIAVDEEVPSGLLFHFFEVALDSCHGVCKSTRRGEDPYVDRTGAPSSRVLNPDRGGGQHGVGESTAGRLDSTVEDVALSTEERTQRLG